MSWWVLGAAVIWLALSALIACGVGLALTRATGGLSEENGPEGEA